LQTSCSSALSDMDRLLLLGTRAHKYGGCSSPPLLPFWVGSGMIPFLSHLYFELLSRQNVQVADFDEVARFLALDGSILAESGKEALAVSASLDGSSSICPRCGGLVSEKRMQAHQQFWCQILDMEE